VDAKRRAQAFQTVDEALKLPMLALSLAFIPLILIPMFVGLSPPAEMAFRTVNWIVWGAFALELTVKTYLAPRRLRYLRDHWYDVLIVLLPFLRPLRLATSARALRGLAVSRVLVVNAHLFASVRAILVRHGFNYALLVGMGLIVLAAGAITYVERDAGGTITDFGTALWWAAETVTTVGYGDVVPVTPEGKGIAVFVMAIGVALFGLLTANIAAFFVQEPHAKGPTATIDDVMAHLRRLEERVTALQAELARVAGAPLPEEAAAAGGNSHHAETERGG
jgi:voltage-gated potassium channel